MKDYSDIWVCSCLYHYECTYVYFFTASTRLEAWTQLIATRGYTMDEMRDAHQGRGEWLDGDHPPGSLDTGSTTYTVFTLDEAIDKGEI